MNKSLGLYHTWIVTNMNKQTNLHIDFCSEKPYVKHIVKESKIQWKETIHVHKNVQYTKHKTEAKQQVIG